jgi:hypothetical protein
MTISAAERMVMVGLLVGFAALAGSGFASGCTRSAFSDPGRPPQLAC